MPFAIEVEGIFAGGVGAPDRIIQHIIGIALEIDFDHPLSGDVKPRIRQRIGKPVGKIVSQKIRPRGAERATERREIRNLHREPAPPRRTR